MVVAAQRGNRESSQKADFIPQFETLRFNKEKLQTAIFITASDTNEVQRFQDGLKECEAVIKANSYVYVILLPNQSQTQAFIKTVEQILRSYELDSVDLMVIDNKSLANDLLIHLKADGIYYEPYIYPAAASDNICDLIDNKLREMVESKKKKEEENK